MDIHRKYNYIKRVPVFDFKCEKYGICDFFVLYKQKFQIESQYEGLVFFN